MNSKELLWESPPIVRDRSNQALPCELEFKKATDRNYLYINNPEYITKYDIVDSGDLVYPQKPQGNEEKRRTGEGKSMHRI